MAAKFPRMGGGGGRAGPFLARSLKVVLYFFFCLYGGWKCRGYFHPKTRLILSFYLK